MVIGKSDGKKPNPQYLMITKEEKRLMGHCKDCIYSLSLSNSMSSTYVCDYMRIKGERRPCKGPLFSADGKCKCKVKQTRAGKRKKTKKAKERFNQKTSL